MKQKTKNLFSRVAELTNKKCSTCQCAEKYRCCDKIFCAIVDQNLQEKGIYIKKTENKEVPFMGKNGCVVPPEQRPFCSTFVCGPHLEEDRGFRREYLSILEKIKSDPAMKDIVFPDLRKI